MRRKRTSRRERREQHRDGRRGRPIENTDHSLASALVTTGLVVLVAIVFAPVRQFQFITLDDPQYLTANSIVGQGLTTAGLKYAFTSTTFYWHPLTWLSHMLDVQLFGMAAGMHHVVNALIHALNTGLLFLALRRMTNATAKSALVAVLFAIHPLHVESVAWAAERKDVLSTFFSMAALYAYVVYAKSPTRARYTIVLGLFALGLLAKPMIVTLPFVFLLLDYWPLARVEWKRLILEKIPLLVLSIAASVVTLYSQRGTSTVVALEAFSPLSRLGNAVISYAAFLRDTVVPLNLAAFYPLEQPELIWVVVCALVMTAITAAAIRYRRSAPFVLIGWLWYLGTLAPVIGFVQAGDQGRADRFTYFPLVGIFVAAVWLCGSIVQRFPSARPFAIASSLVVIVTCWVLTTKQLSYWKNDLAVWTRAVAVTRNNYRAEEHLGVALTNLGRTDDGVEHYLAAIRIWPDYAEAHNNLGAARIDQGQAAEAVKEFEAAVKSDPLNNQYQYNLAVALDAAGRRPDAIRIIEAGLKRTPDYPDFQRARLAFGIK